MVALREVRRTKIPKVGMISVSTNLAPGIQRILEKNNVSIRRKLIGSIRERFQTGAPAGKKGVFERVMRKSERRSVGRPHVGRGINALNISDKNSFGWSVTFYANDHSEPYGSTKWGYNEFWAFTTGLFGRKAVTPVNADLLTIPLKDSEGKVITGANGKPKMIKTDYAGPVNVSGGWATKAVKAVQRDMIEHIGKFI